MWKNVLFTMWFLDFVTVFKESYNCQNSHYLGRNRVFRPFLIFLCYNSLPPSITIQKVASYHWIKVIWVMVFFCHLILKQIKKRIKEIMSSKIFTTLSNMILKTIISKSICLKRFIKTNWEILRNIVIQKWKKKNENENWIQILDQLIKINGKTG